jgi:hypothetical protein
MQFEFQNIQQKNRVYYLFVPKNGHTHIIKKLIILQTLLHVSVFLPYFQGALILRLLKLSKNKIAKKVDRCVLKSVLLIKCGSGCICSSKSVMN